MREYQDSIFLDSINPLDLGIRGTSDVPAESDPRYVKHVHCEGAHFHVISYCGGDERAWVKCSHPRCIENKRYYQDHYIRIEDLK